MFLEEKAVNIWIILKCRNHLNPTQLENSEFLNDLDWIYKKLCGSNSFHLLEDIYLSEESKGGKVDNKFVEVLKDFFGKTCQYIKLWHI